MIKNYKQYNEGINHLLVGPTDEEIWDNYMNGDLKGLIKSIPTSPEDFFNQIMDGCVESNEYNYSNDGVYYSKNGVNLFVHNSINNTLRVSYKYIWSIFENIYRLNYHETKLFIKSQLVDDTEWKELSPFYKPSFNTLP